MARLVCPLCPEQDTAPFNMKLKHYIQHIKEYHAHSPTFSITCGLYGCPRTFHNMKTFQNHVYDVHGGDPLVTNRAALFCGGNNESSPHLEQGENIGLGTTSYSNEMPNDRGKVVVLCVFISLCGQ